MVAVKPQERGEGEGVNCCLLRLTRFFLVFFLLELGGGKQGVVVVCLFYSSAKLVIALMSNCAYFYRIGIQSIFFSWSGQTTTFSQERTLTEKEEEGSGKNRLSASRFGPLAKSG